MKYEITAEFGQSGERTTRVVDVEVGQSMLDAFVATQNLNADEWELADVVPVGEEDATPPADPEFPDRPTHPDFARLSAAVTEMDRRSDEAEKDVTPPQLIGVDAEALAYMARMRTGIALSSLLVALMPTEIQMQGAWCDGFAAGIVYQKRGGSREVTE